MKLVNKRDSFNKNKFLVTGVLENVKSCSFMISLCFI